MVKKAEKHVKSLAGILNMVSGAAIATAMLLVVANVILRKVFKMPILGTYEFTGFFAVLIISLGVSYCFLIDGHIAVDFIVDKFPSSLRNIVDVIMNLLIFAFMSVFTWKSFEYAASLAANNQYSPTTKVPISIMVYIMAFCFAVFCLVSLIKIRESVRKAMKR
jgi:TRAP-type C4-dicarboxylate transport system permease small subunit